MSKQRPCDLAITTSRAWHREHPLERVLRLQRGARAPKLELQEERVDNVLSPELHHGPFGKNRGSGPLGAWRNAAGYTDGRELPCKRETIMYADLLLSQEELAARWRALAADPDSPEFYELNEFGEIILSPSPSNKHELIAFEIAKALKPNSARAPLPLFPC